VNTLCDRAQDGLKLIETWCKEHSLSINPDQTEMVLFSRKTSLLGLKPPEIFRDKLNFSKVVKYVGITLDRKLTWNSHLQSRAKEHMWLMSSVGGQWDVHGVFQPAWSPGSTLQ